MPSRIPAVSYLTSFIEIPCQRICRRLASHKSFLRRHPFRATLHHPRISSIQVTTQVRQSIPAFLHPILRLITSVGVILFVLLVMGNLFSAPENASSRPPLDSGCASITTVDTDSAAPLSTQQLTPPNLSNMVTHTTLTSATNPFSNVVHTVFISHAGEDKATIAIPLREKLRAKGITAFVDEADMPCGTDAVQAMTLAMETAEIGVIILSPEFVAKKWPMKEAMCFLRRREECSREGHRGRKAPTIIPCFYRLSVDDLHKEPRVDSNDPSDTEIYKKSRFLERQTNGEAEADVERIKATLTKLHGLMGVVNYVEANNESSNLMSKRREVLLNELCSKTCESVPEDMRMNKPRDTTRGRNLSLSEADSFRPWFPPKLIGDRAVLDFESRDVEGRPSTPEGLVKQYLLDGNSGAAGIVSLCGLGGVGKSTIVQVLMGQDDTRKSFTDGVHLIKLGSGATSNTLFRRICYILENSGAEKKVESLRERNDLEEVVDFFLTWFQGKRCVLFIDDVWEHSVNIQALSRLCDIASMDGRNRVLITTREYEIASLTENARIVRLDPRGSEVARKILLFHAAILENDEVMTDVADPISDILDVCAGLPVSLAVAGKNVRKMSLVDKRPGDINGVWARYLSRLQTSRQRLLRQNVGSYGNLYATFVASLNFLDEKTPEDVLGFPTKFSFSEMHRRLCVLQKQASVPNTMLMHLWGTDSEERAEMIAIVFVEVGLGGYETMRSESECESRFRLHDSVHDFAVSEAGRNGEVADAHSLLLAGYGSQHEEVAPESEDKKVKWWSRGLQDDGYIHKQLCRHLVGGGWKKGLCELLLTPLWVQRQIEVNGIVCLEDDFDTGIKEIVETEETEEALRLIAKAIDLSSAYVLKNMTELWFQLHGRLQACRQANRRIEEYAKWIETNGSKPRVHSVNRILVGAGGGTRKRIPVGSNVECMASFRDGECVACGCYDGSVVVVNILRSEIERRWNAYEGENKTVSSIAVAQNGTRIVTLSGKMGLPRDISEMLLGTRRSVPSTKGTLDIWDLESGNHVRTIGRDLDTFNCFAITHDKTFVMSASEDEPLQLWDLRSGGVGTPVIKGEGRVMGISLLEDGARAIILYGNGKLKIRNIRAGAEIGEFGDHRDNIICFAVTLDERRVVSGSRDNKVILWDLESRQQIWSSKSESYIGCVAVSKDGNRIASGDSNSEIQIWDVESGDQVCQPLRGHSTLFPGIPGISFLGSKDSIVTSSSWDSTVIVWDIIRETNEKSFNGHGVTVNGVSFTPDGKFVVAGLRDGTLQIWDAASGQIVGDPLQGHRDYVNDVAVTADGRFVVSVSLRDKTVRVWDLESRDLRCALKGHTKSVRCVAVTPKGDRVVTGSNDRTVRVWDLAKMDGSHVVLEGHESSIEHVFVSDDGLRVVSVDSITIFVWSMETQYVLKTAGRDDAQGMSRREVFSFIGEDTVHDDAGLSIPFWSNQIIHGKGSEARVLATLDSRIWSWDISPDKKTICLSLWKGQVAFLKVDV